MKILGIDYGLKRVGIAIGDTDDLIAFPREVMLNTPELLEKLSDYVRSERIEKVVIGLPVTFAGDGSQMSREVEAFTETLSKSFTRQGFSITIEFIDERMTSKTGRQSARRHGLTEKQARGKIDAAAAAILLQAYFDRFGLR